MAEKDIVDGLTKEWLEVVSRGGVALETLGPMLKLISADQYSGASRIFCELLQNMDDAPKRPDSDGVRAFFALVPPDHPLLKDAPETIKSPFGLLLAASDEAGFAPQDVQSLCRSAVSSKTNQFTEHTGTLGDRAQYSMRSSTGEKGIGFKSLFGHVSSPHIFSRHFRFRFKPKSADNPLHVVTPYWVDDALSASWARTIVSTISGGALSPDDAHGTILALPLANAQVYDIVSASLRESIETDTMIIFLRKVRSINTHILFTDGEPWHASYEIQDLSPLSSLGELDAALPLAYPSPEPRLHHFGAKLIELVGSDSESEEPRSSRWLLADYHYGVPEDVLKAERAQQSDRHVPSSQAAPIDIALPLDPETQCALRQTGRIYAYLPTGMGNTNWPALVNAGFSLVTSRESLDPNKPRNAFLLKTALIHAYSIAIRALADALIASPHEYLDDIEMETRLELMLGAFPLAGSQAFLNSRLDALAEMLLKLAWVPRDVSSPLLLLSDVMIAPSEVCDLLCDEKDVVDTVFAHSEMLGALEETEEFIPQLIMNQVRVWGVSDWVTVLSAHDWIALPRHTDEWRVSLIEAVRDAALFDDEVGCQVLSKGCRWLPTMFGGVRSYEAVVHLLCNDQDRAFDEEGLILAPIRHVVDAAFWDLLDTEDESDDMSAAAWLEQAGFAKRFDRIPYLVDALNMKSLPCSHDKIFKLVNDALHIACCDERGGADLRPLLANGTERKLYLNRSCQPIKVVGTSVVRRPVNVCSIYEDLFDWPTRKYSVVSTGTAHFEQFVLHSDYLDVSDRKWRQHRQADMSALANYLFGRVFTYDGKPPLFTKTEPVKLFPFLSEESVDRATFVKLVSWIAEKSATSAQTIAEWAKSPWILRQGDDATLYSPNSLLHLVANSDLAAAFAPIYGPNIEFSASSAASQTLPLPYYEYFGSVSPTIVGVPAWSDLSLADRVSVLLECWQENATNFDVVGRLVKVLANMLKSFTLDATYKAACEAVFNCLSANALVPVGSDRTLLQFHDGIILPPDNPFYQHALWDYLLKTESCPIVLWTRGMLGPDMDDLLRRVSASLNDISQSQLLTTWNFVAENISLSSDATTDISSVETFIWSLINEVLSVECKESLEDKCLPLDGEWQPLSKLFAFDSSLLQFSDAEAELRNIYRELYSYSNILDVMSRESQERCREGIARLIKSGKHVSTTSEITVFADMLESLYGMTRQSGADIASISAIAWRLYAHIAINFPADTCQLLCRKFGQNRWLILSDRAMAFRLLTNRILDSEGIQRVEKSMKPESSGRKLFARQLDRLRKRNLPDIIKNHCEGEDTRAKITLFFSNVIAKRAPFIDVCRSLVEYLRTTKWNEIFNLTGIEEASWALAIEELSWSLIKEVSSGANDAPWGFVYHEQQWIRPETAFWVDEKMIKSDILGKLEFSDDASEKKKVEDDKNSISKLLADVLIEVRPSNLWRTAHKYSVPVIALKPLEAKSSIGTLLKILRFLRASISRPSGPVATLVWGIVAVLAYVEKFPSSEISLVHMESWLGLPAPSAAVWIFSPHDLPDGYETASSASTSDGSADSAQLRRKEFARGILWRASNEINWGASASSAGLSHKSAVKVASVFEIADRKLLPSSSFIEALRLLAAESNKWISKMRLDYPKVPEFVHIDFIYTLFTWLAAKAGDEEVKHAALRKQASLRFPTLDCRRFVTVDRLVIGSDVDHDAEFEEASDAERFILGITTGHLPILLSSLGAVALDKVPTEERLILEGSPSIVPFDDPSWPSLFLSDHLARILEALASTWFPDVARVVGLLKSTELVECDELSRVVTYRGIGTATYEESSRLLPSKSFMSEYVQLGRPLPKDFNPICVECRGTEDDDIISLPLNSLNNRLVVVRDEKVPAALALAGRVLALKAPSPLSDKLETPEITFFRTEVLRWCNSARSFKYAPLAAIQDQVDFMVKTVKLSTSYEPRTKKASRKARLAATLEEALLAQDGTAASPPTTDMSPPTTDASTPELESLKPPQQMIERTQEMAPQPTGSPAPSLDPQQIQQIYQQRDRQGPRPSRQVWSQDQYWFQHQQQHIFRSTHSDVGVPSEGIKVEAVFAETSQRSSTVQQRVFASWQEYQTEEPTFDGVDLDVFNNGSFSIVAPPSLAPSMPATFEFGAATNQTPTPFVFYSKIVGGRPPAFYLPESSHANAAYAVGSEILAQQIGEWGEEFAFQTILPEMFPKSKIVKTGGFEHSHDCIVYSQDDQVECIVEVKVAQSRNEFVWSGAQIDIARTEREKYLLLLIVPASGQVIPIQNPFACFDSGRLRISRGAFELTT